MSRQLCVYVDVDETLVRCVGTKRIPMPAMIRHVWDLYREGALLYCWSSGGAEYARESAKEFGILECFAGFLPKPHVMIDDQAVEEWPQFMHVHPAGIRTHEEYVTGLAG